MTSIVYLGLGIMILCGAWIPLFLRNVPLSLPMLALGTGLLLPTQVGISEPLRSFAGPVEHITAIVLLISIYGAGLNIDRPFSLKSWASTWRLLLLAMPISIALIAAAGTWLLGLSLPLALLLAAQLSPTDPVLASNVQVGPPGTGEDGEVRFALTSEAGMNDGIALPFVTLALMLLQGAIGSPADLAGWAALQLIGGVVAGAALGAFIGWLLVAVNRILPQKLRLVETNSGIAGIGVSLITYGVCELIGVNGFVAVFFTAVAIRNTAKSHDYSRQMSHAGKQIERAMMVFIMVLTGYAMGHGLLEGVDTPMLAFAVLVLLVVRPLAGSLGFIGSRIDFKSRAAVSFLGIRGIGTIYYLAYSAERVPASGDQRVFAAAGLTVLLSVLLYGASSSFVMQALDRDRSARGQARGAEPP